MPGSGQKVSPACGVQSWVGFGVACYTELGWSKFHKGGAGALLALPQAVRVGYCPRKSCIQLLGERVRKPNSERGKMQETILSELLVFAHYCPDGQFNPFPWLAGM